MAPFATLYTVAGRVHPRARKIYAAATLNGLELATPSDFDPPESNRTPEFLQKFPLGKIPALETASGFTLVESSAIASYVADSGPKRDQLLGGTSETRAKVQQWILFNDLQMEASLWTLAAWRQGIEEYDAARERSADADLKRWLGFCESHLEERSWFVNDDDGGPSLADLTIGGTLFALYFSYVDAEMRSAYPNVLKFFNGLKQIPELTKLYTGPMVEKRKQPQ